jgi:hypothetical protein
MPWRADDAATLRPGTPERPGPKRAGRCRTRHTLLRRLFPWFKWTVFGLIGLNVALFFTLETVTEGLDSLAWLSLLLLFEWESTRLDRPGTPPRHKALAHAGRAVAYVLVLYSALSYSSAAYAAEHGRLDTWNSWTWIVIVLVLEAEVRYPRHYSRTAWLLRNGFKTGLYGALFVYASLWGHAGEWLDCYDALLWILCFFAIELNLVEAEAPSGNR